MREFGLFHIVLHEPEIPPNTGNIIRLCSNTGTTLSLIEPLGFELSDKRMRRAGLDYHETANLQVFPNLDQALATRRPNQVWLFSTHGSRTHAEANFQSGDALVFGAETRGLPLAIREAAPQNTVIRIPMCAESRSMNLSNSVAVALYEAWRQIDFAGAVTPPSVSDS